MILIISQGVCSSHRAFRSLGVGVYVSNGLCEHLWACERCVYFCEQAGSGQICLANKRALKKNTDGEQRVACVTDANG